MTTLTTVEDTSRNLDAEEGTSIVYLYMIVLVAAVGDFSSATISR